MGGQHPPMMPRTRPPPLHYPERTMNRISRLAVPDEHSAHEGVQTLWAKAEANLGFVPNVFRAQALNSEQFLAWWTVAVNWRHTTLTGWQAAL